MKFLLVFSILFLVCGCTGRDAGETTTESGNMKRVDLIDETGFKDLVANRDGKILLVNVWATWCVPCREEFPDLVKIADQYHSQNVEVIGISADFPDEIESKIEPFLKSQNAGFKNYVKNFEDDEAFINSVNPEWSGALPATFVYDTDGVLRESHFGENDLDGFRQMIEQVRQAR